MRSLQLEAALTDYVGDAAERLRGDLAAGAEVPFELEQQGRRRGGLDGPALYCYRPLTRAFIEDRWTDMQRLPSYGQAAALLARFDGLERYLSALGVETQRRDAGGRVGVALAALLGEVFDEQSDFELHPERLEAALKRLEQSSEMSASEETLVATLHGLTITSGELVLASGLTIAQPRALEGLPAGAREDASGEGHLVVVLSAGGEQPHGALTRGRGVLKELLRALRLFGDGRVTYGPMAWVRLGGGTWGPMALGEGGRPHGMLVVTAEQEDELRAFCNLVSRRAPHGDQLAWALHRFELACARNNPYDALSDILLALRALLEPEGPASGLLPGRLAALCATPEQRMLLTERALRAIALERAVIDGSATPSSASEAIARDMADHLRALLRDVICGHLSADLIGLADELLLADAPAPEPAQPVAVVTETETETAPAQAQAQASPAAAFEPVATGGETTTVHAVAQGPLGAVSATAASSAEQPLGYSSEAEEILDLLI
ncbi:MAG TPA: hypothetical protein VGG08_00690 [Solirubrobacteraceae bacterium]|jgi:hypothetical protein